MNVLVWLTAILFILMIVIGGKRCTIFSIFIFKLWSALYNYLLMTSQKNSPILLTLIACTVISWISLFLLMK